uniref:Uncharacterized protein n=1 Tax=Coccolithus braarudii TaxID=221442 RepID=A0A7S0LH77_9EUKA|mmetsp:Transcript_40259/g.85942  ORF Transcript_40259/g.85942 Transcript_40259/m.85942 type:complete len:621 (+) Transcript_40259:124-1986(+)
MASTATLPASVPASLQPTIAEGIEEHNHKAKALLEAGDFAGAAAEGSRALDVLPDLADISIVRGKALLAPLLDCLMTADEGTKSHICRQDFKGAYDAFRLALIMDPNNTMAAMELERLSELLKRMPDFTPQQNVEVEDVDVSGPDISHGHGHQHGPGSQHEHGADCEHGADWKHGHGHGHESDAYEMLDVIIIGAGAAGIGSGFMLTNVFGLDPSRVMLLERGEAVGTSFRKWPEEMRFISPSFNQQGWTNSFDLNSVVYGTSPAFTLHAQHPSGEQYADYLSELAEAAKLNVKTRTEVLGVKPDGNVFDVHVRTASADGAQKEETLHARYVVWAAGEFQYPREKPDGMAGAELCVHNSRVRSWAQHPGDNFVVIGGYESGADAAVNLAKAGKQCTVLASTAAWNVQTADPSTELAPYTGQRLRDVTAAGFSPRPKLLAPLRVLRVEAAAEGGFNVVAAWKATEDLQLHQLRKPIVGGEDCLGAEARLPGEGKEVLVHTPHPPVLATGFEGSVASAARHLFNLADDSDDKAKGCLAGAPMLTAEDESTKAPGVFLVGPSVRHGKLSFCFVYKFRQRFAIVANAICRGLGRDTTSAVEACRKMNMYLDDFTCCKSSCGEAC